MKKVYFGTVAAEVLGQYFENYKGGKINDLSNRALNYSRIREFLTTFDTSETYILDGKKYVNIEDICVIEYVMRNNAKEILVTDIFLY
ncbi:MAG: hypothetical protein LBU91_06825 [Bacteroidales bacterium]|nr:hypothetical protein [Bacteroidales bacterium]